MHLITSLAEHDYLSAATWTTIAVLGVIAFVNYVMTIELFEGVVVCLKNRRLARAGAKVQPIDALAWQADRRHDFLTGLGALALGGVLGTIRLFDAKTFDWYLDGRLALWPDWGSAIPFLVNVVLVLAAAGAAGLVVSATWRIGVLGLLLAPVYLFIAAAAFTFGLVAGPVALLLLLPNYAWAKILAAMTLLPARVLEPVLGRSIPVLHDQ